MTPRVGTVSVPLIDADRYPALWMLVAFVLTTILTRVVTRQIRANDERKALLTSEERAAEEAKGSLIKNIHIGGVHVHHQVWGILLVMVVGALLIVYRPTGAIIHVYAVAFGIGAALALDEFAMWLHLEDVYWSEEGRKSISALMIAGAVVLGLVVGADPLDLNNDGGAFESWVVAVSVLVNLAFLSVCALKGKLQFALIGVFVPFVAPIGAIRLAKPGSWWARWRYRPTSKSGSRKLARAERRFGPAYIARWQRLQDLIGGTPVPGKAPEKPARLTLH